MVTIRFYQDTDKNLWDSYVLNHPQGTFFHLIGWKNVIEKTFGHKSFYLLAISDQNSALSPQPSILDSQHSSDPVDSFTHSPNNSLTQSSPESSVLQPQAQRSSDLQQGNIVGLLPLFSIRSLLFGKSLVSVPFAAYGGILADNEEIKRQLLEEAKKLTHTESLDYLELRSRDGRVEDLATKDLYVSFQRTIYEDLDSNMEAIPRKSRRMVRQGEKAGLTWEFGDLDLISTFYGIFAQSYHRLGSPVFPKQLFLSLLDEFKDKANILIVRTQGETPVAGVLSFFFKDTVLPYYAGSLVEYRNLAPNDYMYWQLMKYGCEKGYKIFDFGRSKVGTGSHDFKRHWGFEPEPLKYQYYLNGAKEIPNLSPANPKYQKKIEMWQKLPLWATKIIGPHIVKYIP